MVVVVPTVEDVSVCFVVTAVFSVLLQHVGVCVFGVVSVLLDVVVVVSVVSVVDVDVLIVVGVCVCCFCAFALCFLYECCCFIVS